MMKTHKVHKIYAHIHLTQKFLQQCASCEQTAKPNSLFCHSAQTLPTGIWFVVC